ncbi:MAG: RNA methyltransferase [Bacteroidetes bacterium]|nr:MAG: RNA methyltransferase [Bacteroidota bacterium]
MTPERKERIIKTLARRQANLTVVLENVFDPHNISAVMRSCDAVGIQEIHVLNTAIPRHKKWGRRSSSSAAKWLTIHQHSKLEDCLRELKARNFKILASRLSEDSSNLYDIDFSIPIALVFGNEHSGVSDELFAVADGCFQIPQVGMIRSLNISVACAVTIYEAYRQKSLAGHYNHQSLSDPQLTQIFENWMLNSDQDENSSRASGE